MAILVPIIPCVCIFLFCLLIGFIGNTALIIATIQNKHLHNANNILIALSAFGDILHQAGHIPFAYFIFTGITFTPLRTCIWIQLLPNFGLNFAMAILFFTGIDRSMAILKPLRYRTMRRRISVPAMTIPAALYAVVILILACIYAINNDGKVICVLVAIYSGQFDWIWGILATLVNLATIILYAVLSRIIVKAETSNRNFELLQTLKIAVAFVGMGHLASTTIYMVTNEEYRNAFRRQFKKLPCLKNTVNLQTKHTMQQITTVH
ncbi:unnamed protein product [Wuchereria bancrofti]|uniref:G-protein coupled receptors family 1 profile domain-containing protein n=1 Tax=Wuchereria bancrofti TaxID=6293 RepID=A0A3P7DH01_WUCBA|nr:unnamed protein product [Wuchereria bancrofti]